MDDFYQRMVEELAGLQAHIVELEKFIQAEVYKVQGVAEQIDMYDQLQHMAGYRNCLARRIQRIEEHNAVLRAIDDTP